MDQEKRRVDADVLDEKGLIGHGHYNFAVVSVGGLSHGCSVLLCPRCIRLGIGKKSRNEWLLKNALE